MSATYRKKHYEQIAAVINVAKRAAGPEALKVHADEDPDPDIVVAARLGVATVQAAIMKMFKEDNREFRELEFVRLCGSGEDDEASKI